MVTSDLGRVTTSHAIFHSIGSIVVTSDLGRVTTIWHMLIPNEYDCGDVRSRTSYNDRTQSSHSWCEIVVTSDLGRVTTSIRLFKAGTNYCGDVRSRTSYNSYL